MAEPHPKRAFLEAVGALHAHPEHVCAPLFERHRFFDDRVAQGRERIRRRGGNSYCGEIEMVTR